MTAKTRITWVGYSLAAIAIINLAAPLTLWYFDLRSRLPVWTASGFDKKDEVIEVLMGIITGISRSLLGFSIMLIVCAVIIIRHARKLTSVT